MLLATWNWHNGQLKDVAMIEMKATHGHNSMVPPYSYCLLCISNLTAPEAHPGPKYGYIP